MNRVRGGCSKFERNDVVDARRAARGSRENVHAMLVILVIRCSISAEVFIFTPNSLIGVREYASDLLIFLYISPFTAL